jgi:hypothetical protein
MESSNPDVEKPQEEKKEAPVIFLNLAEDTPCK